MDSVGSGLSSLHYSLAGSGVRQRGRQGAHIAPEGTDWTGSE